MHVKMNLSFVDGLFNVLNTAMAAFIVEVDVKEIIALARISATRQGKVSTQKYYD